MNPVEEVPPAPSSSAHPRLIKRYANRKLYDTVASRYVTREKLCEMIREGLDVRIVDHDTQEDWTSITLAQILFEQEKKNPQIPLTLLRALVRDGGEAVSGYLTP